MTRKIILNLAISLDGYIAEKNGGFAWIRGDGDKSHDTKAQFDFPGFEKAVDCIIMGKNAYLDCGIKDITDYQSKHFIVATSQTFEEKPENVELFHGDLPQKMEALKEEEGKDIWLFGGGILIDPLIKADLVDEFIIGIIPIILGDGKRLFLDHNPMLKLHMEECMVKEGVIMVKYTRQ